MSKKNNRLISLLSRKRDNDTRESSSEDSSNKLQNEEITTKKKNQNEKLFQQLEQDGTNPIYSMIRSNSDISKSNKKDVINDEIKRTQSLATVSGITNIIKGIGRGISAASGAKIADINTDVFDSANSYLQKLQKIEDDEEIDDKNNATKTAISSVRKVTENREKNDKESSKKTSNDKFDFSSSLEKSRNKISKISKSDTDDANKKLEAENKKLQTAIEKSRTQNYSYIQSQLAKNYKKEQEYIDEAKKNQPKVVTYVKRDNKSIPIYEDTMVDIYRLANYENLLEPYYYEKDAKGRAYQLSIATDKIFDIYGVEDVLSGKAVEDRKKINSPYLFNSSYNE